MKFTVELSFKELPFFYILITNQNDQTITNIYHKPIDTPKCHHFKSHHPQNCIKSIPYSLARTSGTIVPNKDLWQTRWKELRVTLHQRGYPAGYTIKRYTIKTTIYHDIYQDIPLKDISLKEDMLLKELRTLQKT